MELEVLSYDNAVVVEAGDDYDFEFTPDEAVAFANALIDAANNARGTIQ